MRGYTHQARPTFGPALSLLSVQRICSVQSVGEMTLCIASHLGCKQQHVWKRAHAMRRRRLELRLHGQVSDGLLWKLCKGKSMPATMLQLPWTL